MKNPIKVLVVGCGNMGASHAKAYHQLEEISIVGLVSRGDSKKRLNEQLSGGYPLFDDYETALKESRPDAVCISTYPSTHVEYCLKDLEVGAHVFVEKTIAETVEDAEATVEADKKANKKVVVGYILRHHPGWNLVIE